MSDPSPYVPGDLPGLLDGWCGPIKTYMPNRQERIPSTVDPWHDGPQYHTQPWEVGLDCLRPEVRDRCARWLGWVFGVPVGVTAPGWEPVVGMDGVLRWQLVGAGGKLRWFGPEDVPALASIPLDSPDRDALALAAVCRWVGEEIRAGRITIKESDHVRV